MAGPYTEVKVFCLYFHPSIITLCFNLTHTHIICTVRRLLHASPKISFIFRTHATCITPLVEYALDSQYYQVDCTNCRASPYVSLSKFCHHTTWSYRLKPDISKEYAFIFNADIQIELLQVLLLKSGNQRSHDVTARESITWQCTTVPNSNCLTPRNSAFFRRK
jgi:hypothetical protein